MREFPVEARDFAKAFVVLQKARQQAYYALDADAYQKSDVLGHVAAAELAINRFEQADVAAKDSFAFRGVCAIQATDIVASST